MDVASLQLSSFVYLLAAAGYVSNLLSPSEWARRGGPLLLFGAYLLHTVFVVSRGLSDGALPVSTFSEGLAFFAWFVVGIYLLIQNRYKLSEAGAVIVPLAFVLTLGAVLFYSGAAKIPDYLMSPWLSVHIALAFLGNAVFALAFAVALLYIAQENLLKSKERVAFSRRLPSLERLDRMNYVFLIWGFPLLTAGIVSGGVWAASNWGHFWSGEAREIFSILTWLFYATLLQLRLIGGLRGRRAARLTIFAFGVLVFSYVAVALLPLAGHHGGGLAS